MAASGARRSILLLVSSMLAGGRSVRLGPHIVRILRGGDWKIVVRPTTFSDDPMIIIGEVAPGSFAVALGDDGCLGAVTRGYHKPDATLVPMPGGRGNGLCCILRIDANPLVRARSLVPLGSPSNEAGADSSDWLASRVRPLDGMWVCSRDGVYLALGIVSIDPSVRANIPVNESSFISGPLAYGYRASVAPASHKPTEIVTTVDGVERNVSGWIASASSSGVFGDSITLVESSDMSDGVLEVCHVSPLSLSHTLSVLVRVVAGRAKAHPTTKVESARVVSFAASAGMITMTDGNRIAPIPFTVDVTPRVASALVRGPCGPGQWGSGPRRMKP